MIIHCTQVPCAKSDQLLSFQSMEKQRMDAINDDAKHMEKIAHKRSLLMKKVRSLNYFMLERENKKI